MTTNFSDMDNAALRRWIAERLGYTVVQHFTGGQTKPIKGERPLWKLLSPAPEFKHIGSLRMSVAGAWCEAPDWPEDVGAALALPMPPLGRWHLEQLTNGQWHGAVFGVAENAYGDNPARVLCEAWAQMAEAREANDGT